MKKLNLICLFSALFLIASCGGNGGGSGKEGSVKDNGGTEGNRPSPGGGSPSPGGGKPSPGGGSPSPGGGSPSPGGGSPSPGGGIPSPGSSTGGSAADKTDSEKSDIIYKEMWHLNNTGQKAYSDKNATKDIDLNLSTVTETGKSVKVLVADTPVELDHVDLTKNAVKDGSIDLYVSPAVGINRLSVPMDESAHGTSVAGIIAAAKNEKNGFRGIAYNASIASAKKLSSSSSTIKGLVSSLNQNLNLYNFAYDNNYQIINQSYGATGFIAPSLDKDSLTVYESIEKKIKTKTKGFVIVVAGGNESCDLEYSQSLFKYLVSPSKLLLNMDEIKVLSLSGNELEYMKRVRTNQSNFEGMNSTPYTISVAALGAHGMITDYSSVGPNIWVTGFGGGDDSVKTTDSKYNYSADNNPEIITTNIPNKQNLKSSKEFDKSETKYPENKGYNYTASFNGTSAASPTVSGVIALMLEANPKLTFWEVKYILAKTARSDILVRNPKPYCIKVLEKLNIFDDANSYWSPWDKTWFKNGAGYYRHQFYGFGLVDAKKAVDMAKNLKFPYDGKEIATEVVSDYSINRDVLEGQQDDTITFTVNKDLVIQGVNIYPVLETSKSDGISIELISPKHTESTILFPGNSLIPESSYSTRLTYPGTDQTRAENNLGLTTNDFYEEGSKGTWKLRVKNGNKSGVGHKVKVIGYRMKIVGFPK